MKNFFCILLLIGFGGSWQILCAQQKPIPLDKSALSGQGLKKVELKHEPDRSFFQRNLYRGEDLSIYIVSSQSWKARMDNFSIDEYVYIFNGKSRAKPDKGEDMYFHSGEHFFIPKGYTGEWEVMAADNYHYELSIITTRRASKANISKSQKPELLEQDKLSGLDISLDEKGSYEEILFLGDELRIAIRAEKPQLILLDKPVKEHIISVLAGEIKITDSLGEISSFYTGDYFVLPKGFIGKWESQGHGLCKYLQIEKAP